MTKPAVDPVGPMVRMMLFAGQNDTKTVMGLMPLQLVEEKALDPQSA